MMHFFDKCRVTFEHTDAYQPIEWIKNRAASTEGAHMNGIQIKRSFVATEDKPPQFTVRIQLDLE